jgi:hypothetical protein
MGTQNGLKLEILWREILILTLELKSYGTLKFPHMFVQEVMHLQCLPIQKNYGCAAYIDDPLLNIMYIAVWMPATIVWFY